MRLVTHDTKGESQNRLIALIARIEIGLDVKRGNFIC